MNAVLERLAAALADRYRLDRELGAGGMATVWLAEDLKLERKVALKVLRPDIAALLGADRFLREIRVTASLDHPHILALLDSGNVGGTLYYVTKSDGVLHSIGWSIDHATGSPNVVDSTQNWAAHGLFLRSS